MRTIVFDFGNVIYPFDRESFIKRLVENSPKSEEEVREVYPGSDLHRRHARGETDFDEFYRNIKERTGLKLNKKDFENAYCSIFTRNIGVIELIKKLNGKYRLQLFSDTNRLHYERVIKPISVYHCFDAETLSFRIGALKTEDKGYRDVIDKAGCPPEDIVFTDDIKEYIGKAEEMGMHGIHFRNYDQLVRDLRGLGVEVEF